jgi:hypothetical protein
MVNRKKHLKIPTRKPMVSMSLKELQQTFCNEACCRDVDCNECIFKDRHFKQFEKWVKKHGII